MLAAIRAVPRSHFVPAESSGRAELDAPIPIPHAQVTTQPSLVARMVEALALEGNERVLEIGTGYGWQTALLADLAREVFSVERFPISPTPLQDAGLPRSSSRSRNSVCNRARRRASRAARRATRPPDRAGIA